jgi:transposase-like protein
VSTTGLVDTKQNRARRSVDSILQRRSAMPGASVSSVARRHDVNSNQLFRWRRQLLPNAAVERGAMEPVEIAPDDGRPRRIDREGVMRSRLAVVRGCGFAAKSARRGCGR